MIDRITNSIYFPELEIDEAIQYVNELINHSQYRDKPLPTELPQTYPFDPTALQMLLEGLEKKTPRNINKRCRNVINTALGDEHFETGKSLIDPAYVIKIEKKRVR